MPDPIDEPQLHITPPPSGVYYVTLHTEPVPSQQTDLGEAEINQIISAGTSYETLGLALWARTCRDLPGHIRPLEYFGGVAVGFGEAPRDNATAFRTAVDWCADSGGLVVLGAGVYGVDGSIPLRSYANFTGLGKYHSRILQLASTPTDVFSCSGSPNPSIAFCQFSDFGIDGGWSPGWGNDRSTHTAAGIRLVGDFSGPNDATALTREGVNTMADPFHIVRNLFITGVAGSGLVTAGRGEMHITGNSIDKCSIYGMQIDAPDCWFSHNTVKVTGDSAVRVAAGNNRFSNEKYWFTGMRSDREGVGAGLEIVGAGARNIVGSNLTTQDSWGPGLVLDGDSPMIDGNVDEAGGGRVEQQGFGWRGVRTKARSFIRTGGPVRRGSVRLSVAGGGRMGLDNRPKLVDFDSSGAHLNKIELFGEGVELDPNPIRLDRGYENAKRFDVVTLNGETRHGKLTPAQIADATHRINTDGNVDSVLLTDGTLAIRSGSQWVVMNGTRVTPV